MSEVKNPCLSKDGDYAHKKRLGHEEGCKCYPLEPKKSIYDILIKAPAGK